MTTPRKVLSKEDYIDAVNAIYAIYNLAQESSDDPKKLDGLDKKMQQAVAVIEKIDAKMLKNEEDERQLVEIRLVLSSYVKKIFPETKDKIAILEKLDVKNEKPEKKNVSTPIPSKNTLDSASIITASNKVTGEHERKEIHSNVLNVTLNPKEQELKEAVSNKLKTNVSVDEKAVLEAILKYIDSDRSEKSKTNLVNCAADHHGFMTKVDRKKAFIEHNPVEKLFKQAMALQVVKTTVTLADLQKAQKNRDTLQATLTTTRKGGGLNLGNSAGNLTTTTTNKFRRG